MQCRHHSGVTTIITGLRGVILITAGVTTADFFCPVHPGHRKSQITIKNRFSSVAIILNEPKFTRNHSNFVRDKRSTKIHQRKAFLTIVFVPATKTNTCECNATRTKAGHNERRLGKGPWSTPVWCKNTRRTNGQVRWSKRVLAWWEDSCSHQQITFQLSSSYEPYNRVTSTQQSEIIQAIWL